jgi:predicted ATP-dependent protease
VGGIIEKIEGFFDVCRVRGLSGRQGVMIPEANARHLMLKDEILQAVRDEQFHIHTVSTVDAGLEILCGRPGGARGPDGTFPEGTVNAAIEQALARNIERLRQLRMEPAR